MTFQDPESQSALPGLGAEVVQKSRTFIKQVDHILSRGIRIHKDTLDKLHLTDPDGVGPNTTLRAGLVLVRVESGGEINKFVHAFDPTTEAADAHADAPLTADIAEAVILMEFTNMLDSTSTAVDRQGSGLEHGIVDEDKIIFGTANAARIDKLKLVAKIVKFIKPA